MDADALITLFRERLYNDGGHPLLFNPYFDRDADEDREDAVPIRRANLEAYVRERTQPPRILLLAEAPGPWGCRFSGVPITSEAQLVDPDFPISGRQSSRRDQPHAEYSASIYWRILAPYHEQIFTWNAVPCHPYRKNEPLSIRTPRISELRHFLPLVGEVVRAVGAEDLVAVGRKAERAFHELGLACTYVRHPSQGGATLFASGIRRVLDSQPDSTHGTTRQYDE